MVKRKEEIPENRSFEFKIMDYDVASKEYVLKNKFTGEEKRMSKDLVMEILKEQRVK
jgi:hypothetical protein